MRVGKQRTTTDLAGNFLLKHLKIGKKEQGKYDEDIVLLLDGRTANPGPGLLYPVFEKLIEYEYITPGKPNRYTHHGPMYIRQAPTCLGLGPLRPPSSMAYCRDAQEMAQERMGLLPGKAAVAVLAGGGWPA